MNISNIPNAGKGLFVKREFEIDEIIGEFRGPIIKTKDCINPIFNFEERLTYINEEISLIVKNFFYVEDKFTHNLPKFIGKDGYVCLIFDKKLLTAI